MLLGGDGLDDQQGGDHQNDGDDHADHSALDQTGNDEADEGNGSHGDTIGQLGRHMVQVEATSIRKRIEYDIYYIENWSMSFDFKIMFLTIFRGFINENAY